MKTVCCLCKKKELVEDRWVSISWRKYFEYKKEGNISHGYCPECAAAEIAKLKQLKPEGI